MTKAQHISNLILQAYNRSGDIKQAINEVLGEGTSEKLISELYDALREAK